MAARRRLDAELVRRELVASRSEERGSRAVEDIKKETPSAKVELLLLNLARQESVRTFAETFRSRAIHCVQRSSYSRTSRLEKLSGQRM